MRRRIATSSTEEAEVERHIKMLLKVRKECLLTIEEIRCNFLIRILIRP